MKCNKDCNACKHLNINTDEKGYPWSYECIKHNNSVFYRDFESTKVFESITELKF